MIAACELARPATSSFSAATARRRCSRPATTWLDYSERMLRQEIAKVPDGLYETEVGWLDDDGRNRGKKLPIKVAVEIEGDEITFDLTGSSAEVPTGYNCPFEGTTVSAMTFITRMIFLDEATYPVFVPQNEGMLAPVKVDRARRARSSTRTYPRACFARFCQVQRAVDLALRALAPVDPGQDHGRQLRPPRTSSPTRDSTRRRASTGSTSRSTRAPTAAARRATGSTRSTA